MNSDIPNERDIILKHALINREKFIYGLKFKDLPVDIKKYLKSNRKLTKAEKYMSAFLQACVRYGYIEKYKSQQIVRMGAAGNYIMPDFWVMEPDVIVEVDGPEHDPVRDGWRDKKVKELFEIETFRVTNDALMKDNRAIRESLLRKFAELDGLDEEQIKLRTKEFWARQARGE